MRCEGMEGPKSVLNPRQKQKEKRGKKKEKNDCVRFEPSTFRAGVEASTNWDQTTVEVFLSLYFGSNLYTILQKY